MPFLTPEELQLIGAAPAPQRVGALRRAADVGVAGLAAIPETVGAVAGLAGLIPGVNLAADPISRGASQFGEDIRQGLTSDQRLAEQEANRQRVQAAGAGRTGFDAIGAQAREALSVAVDDPLSAVEAAAGSIPYMIGGGALARGANAVNAALRPAAGALSRPVAAGIGEGGITAGAVASDIVNRGGPDQQFYDRYAAIPAGVVTGLIPGAISRVPGLRNARDIDEAITGRIAGIPGREAGEQVAQNFLPRVAGGIGREALEEGLQSPQEQAFTNIGLREPWYENVGSSAVEGALAGGIFGGGMNLRGNRPAPPPVNQNDPVDLTSPSEVQRTRDMTSAPEGTFPTLPPAPKRDNRPVTSELATGDGPVKFNRKDEAAAQAAEALLPRFNSLNDELAYLDNALSSNLVDQSLLPQVMSRRDQIVAERSAIIAALDAAEKNSSAAGVIAEQRRQASALPLDAQGRPMTQGGFDFDAPAPAPVVQDGIPYSLTDVPSRLSFAQEQQADPNALPFTPMGEGIPYAPVSFGGLQMPSIDFEQPGQGIDFEGGLQPPYGPVAPTPAPIGINMPEVDQRGLFPDAGDSGEVLHNNQYAADLFRLFSVGMQPGAPGQVDQSRQQAVNIGRQALGVESPEFARYKAAIKSGNLQAAYNLVNAKPDAAFGGQRTAEEGYKRANEPTLFRQAINSFNDIATKMEKAWSAKSRGEAMQHLRDSQALLEQEQKWLDEIRDGRQRLIGERKAKYENMQLLVKMSLDYHRNAFETLQNGGDLTEHEKQRKDLESAYQKLAGWSYNKAPKADVEAERGRAAKLVGDLFKNIQGAIAKLRDVQGKLNKEAAELEKEAKKSGDLNRLMTQRDRLKTSKEIAEFLSRRFRRPIEGRDSSTGYSGDPEYVAFMRRLMDLPASWPSDMPAPREARAQYAAKMKEVRATVERISELENAMQSASEQAQAPVEQLEMFGDAADAPAQQEGKRARAANRVKRFAYKWFRTGYLSKEDYERVVAETEKEGAKVGANTLRDMILPEDEAERLAASRAEDALGGRGGEDAALSPAGRRLQARRVAAADALDKRRAEEAEEIERIAAGEEESAREAGRLEDSRVATTVEDVNELIDDLRLQVEKSKLALSSEYDQTLNIDKVYKRVLADIEIALARLFDVIYYVDLDKAAPVASKAAVLKAKKFIDSLPDTIMPAVIEAAKTRGKNMTKGASPFVEQYNDAALGSFMARMEDINGSTEAKTKIGVDSPYAELDKIRKRLGIAFKDRNDLYRSVISDWNTLALGKTVRKVGTGYVASADHAALIDRFTTKYSPAMLRIMLYGVNTNTARSIRSTVNRDPGRLTQNEAATAASASQRAMTNRLQNANRLAAKLIETALEEPVIATLRDLQVATKRRRINALLDKLLPVYNAGTKLPAAKAGFITAIADNFRQQFKLPGATKKQQDEMDELVTLLRDSGDLAGVKDAFKEVRTAARRTRGKDKEGASVSEVDSELEEIYGGDTETDADAAKAEKAEQSAGKAIGKVEAIARGFLSDGMAVTGQLKSITNTDGTTTWTLDGAKDGVAIRRSVNTRGSEVIESTATEATISTKREIPQPPRERLTTNPVPRLDERIDVINEKAKAAEAKREDVLDDKAVAALNKMGVEPAAVVEAAQEINVKVKEAFSFVERMKTPLERASAIAAAIDRLASGLTKAAKLKLAKILKDAADKASTYPHAGAPEKGAAAAHRLVKGATTGKEVLERIAASKSAPPLYRLLARRLLSTDAASATFRAVENRFRNRGEYNAESHTITLYNNGGLHTILHELMHAAVVRRMTGANGTPIHNLFEQVRAAAEAQGLNFYGISTVDEFVAEAFTNPNFQRFLATVGVPGRPVKGNSMWRMFVAAVKRFLGLNAVPNSALDQVISLTGEILSDDVVRTDGTFNMSATAALTQSREALSVTLRDWGKKGYLSLAFFHDLVEMAKDMLPAVVKLDEALNASKTTKRRIELEVEGIAGRFAKLDAARQKVVNKMIENSTYDQQWGYQPTWKKDVRVDSKLAARWASLSKEEQEIIDAVFEHGEKIKNRQIKMMKEGNRTDVADFMSKLSGPYAPFKRHGNYLMVAKSAEYVSANDLQDRRIATALESNEEHYVMEQYESLAAASARAAELRATGKYSKVEAFEKDVEFREANYIPAHVIQNLQAMVKVDEKSDKAVTEATTKMLQDMYLNSLSEYSARQSARIRRRIAGYSEDMMRSFVTQGRADAAFSAVIEHGQTIKDLMNELQSQKTSGERGTREDRARMYNMIVRHYVDSLKFNNTPWSDKVMAATSFMQLLSNPSYYLTNLTQPVMVTLPVLAGKYGYLKSWKALTDGYAMIGQVLKGNAFSPRLVFDELAKKDPELVKALERSQMLGVLDIGIDSEMGQFEHANNPAMKMAAAVTWKLRQAARSVEIINRISAGVATYRLEKERLLAEGSNADMAHAKAADEAVSVLRRTQGDYSSEAAPLAIKYLPKFMTQYRKYQLMQLMLLTRIAKQAFRGASPEEKAIARAQLGFTFAHAGAFAGAIGLPLFNVLAFLWSGRDDDDDDLEVSVREALPEDLRVLLTRGIPGYMGMDVAQRIGWGNAFSILPYSDLDVSRKGVQELVFGLSGPVGGLAAGMAEGVKKMRDGDTMQGMALMMPKGLGNAFKAWDLKNNGLRLSNGDMVLKPDEITAAAAFAQAIGLPSTTITETQWLKQKRFETEQAIQTQERRIRKQYTTAFSKGDAQAVLDAKAEFKRVQDRKRELHGGDVLKFGKRELRPQTVSALLKARQAKRKREQELDEIYGEQA